MVSEVLINASADMQKCVDGLAHELGAIRTGRASPALVEDVLVEYHGANLPIKQLANIAVPEPALLTIQPWDRTSLRAVEKALLKANLGLNPSNDGNLIRLAIPPLSEERRSELAKLVGKRVEERKVALRNIRRDYVSKLKQLEKEKQISQNEMEMALKKVDEVTDAFIVKTGETGAAKEKEIKEL
ncbi:MAG: ribosome recycling factor [Dehalococcoidia bacterium]|jgi:ribosome recycling factor|nr:ribosome recycling factor [Dehalococcoidia bacterium]